MYIFQRQQQTQSHINNTRSTTNSTVTMTSLLATSNQGTRTVGMALEVIEIVRGVLRVVIVDMEFVLVHSNSHLRSLGMQSLC